MAIILDVDGIHCGNCAKRIAQAIRKIEPSVRVNVNVDAGTVEVDPALDRAKLISAIENAGYSLRKAA